jgi:hypothetical protein
LLNRALLRIDQILRTILRNDSRGLMMKSRSSADNASRLNTAVNP